MLSSRPARLDIGSTKLRHACAVAFRRLQGNDFRSDDPRPCDAQDKIESNDDEAGIYPIVDVWRMHAVTLFSQLPLCVGCVQLTTKQ